MKKNMLPRYGIENNDVIREKKSTSLISKIEESNVMHDWNIYIDEITHLHPYDSIRVTSKIIDNFALLYDKNPENYRKEVLLLQWEFREYLEISKNKISKILETIECNDIAQIIIEADWNEITGIEDTVELIWSIIDYVFENFSEMEKRKIKQDMMILYWWPYIYLKATWAIDDSIKLVAGEDNILKEKSFDILNENHLLRENIISIAMNSSWDSKISYKKFSIIDQAVNYSLNNNDLQYLEQKEEELLLLFENNDEVHACCEDRIKSVINFLNNSKKRDNNLASVVSKNTGNSIVVYWKNHAKWLIEWLKKWKHEWKITSLVF